MALKSLLISMLLLLFSFVCFAQVMWNGLNPKAPVMFLADDKFLKFVIFSSVYDKIRHALYVV